MPIPVSAREKLNMLPFNTEQAHDQNMRHVFLARAQGTLTAILPLHTREEKSLFRLLVATNPLFVGPNQPNWYEVAKIWSSYCNGVNIFYKVCYLSISAPS